MLSTIKDNRKFTVKFRGVRGGYPMPGESTVKYGGNTTCLEIRVGDHLLIIDAGTGIISLGKEMVENYARDKKDIHCVVLFTHLHHDHIQGMPFFLPLFHPRGDIDFYGFKPSGDTSLESEIMRQVLPPVSPLGAEKIYAKYHFEHLHESDGLVFYPNEPEGHLYRMKDGAPPIRDEYVHVQVHHGRHHPKDGVLIYRISYAGKSIVIATDTEGFVEGDQQLIQFTRDADLLIHDAEYDEHEYGKDNVIRQGWGHSTWRMAVDVAMKARARKLVLFHHNTAHADTYLEYMVEKAQQVFPDTILAMEGLELSLIR